MTDGKTPRSAGTQAALAAISRQQRAIEQERTARTERDNAICAMYADEGLTVPNIYRALDGVLSRSGIRVILQIGGVLSPKAPRCDLREGRVSSASIHRR